MWTSSPPCSSLLAPQPAVSLARCLRGVVRLVRHALATGIRTPAPSRLSSSAQLGPRHPAAAVSLLVLFWAPRDESALIVLDAPLTRVNCDRADVKAIVEDAAVMDAVAPKARKAYNLDQMTSIDGPDGKVRLSLPFQASQLGWPPLSG